MMTNDYFSHDTKSRNAMYYNIAFCYFRPRSDYEAIIYIWEILTVPKLAIFICTVTLLIVFNKAITNYLYIIPN